MESKVKLLFIGNSSLEKNVRCRLLRINTYSSVITNKVDRFKSSDGKITIGEINVNDDVYIFSDIGNYSITYEMYGMTKNYGNDEHFMDLLKTVDTVKRVGAARITVIMPFLYASRQHRDLPLESHDCRLGLRLLESLGVDRIITFDAHDPKVQDALNKCQFYNLFATDLIVNKLGEISNNDFSNFLVIGPDKGARERAELYGNLMGVDVETFDKERDTTIVINGQNQVKKQVYNGQSVLGRNILIVDDMIASGGSMLKAARYLKENGAKDIRLTSTFPLFSNGESCVIDFDKAHSAGYFEEVITPNFVYVPSYIKDREWFREVDCSGRLVEEINKLSQEPIIKQKTMQLKRA